MSNQISGKKKFSVKTAQKYSDAFGYSLEFLLFGKGNLYAPGRGVAITRPGQLPELYMDTSVMNEGRKVRTAVRILEILNNQTAIAAYQAALEDDAERYNELYDRLAKEFAWDIPFVNGNKEALMKIRKFFADAHEKAAKELIQAERDVWEGTTHSEGYVSRKCGRGGLIFFEMRQRQCHYSIISALILFLRSKET